MDRILIATTSGPVVALAAGVAGICLYCLLRLNPRAGASYRALHSAMSNPSRLERYFLGAIVVAGFAALVFRISRLVLTAGNAS